MAFTLPNFNVSCFIWHPPNAPPNPPDENLACQFYVTSRGQWGMVPGDNTLYIPPIYLRLQPGSALLVGDVVECPPATGRFYVVRWVEVMHLGFPNQYLAGILEQQVGAPPPGGELLLEDGTAIWLEDGTPILLE